MGFTVIAILTSYSRAGLLALGAVAVMVIWKSRRRVVFGLALAVILVMAVRFMPDQWFERMGTIQTYEGDSSAQTLAAFAQAASPPLVLNVTGPETASVRDIARRFVAHFRSHMEIEDHVVLPRASRALGPDDLDAIAVEMESRRTETPCA